MMPELSLNILDLAENSFAAGAEIVKIFIDEQDKEGTLSITVTDNGKGMNSKTVKEAQDPLFSSKNNKNWGLGIPFLKQTADLCEGSFELKSTVGRGTKIKVILPVNHIDRPPLGNISDTIVTLAAGHRDRDFNLVLRRNDKKYELSTEIIRKETGNMAINNPDILLFIEKDIKAGIKDIGLEG